ncbi:putative GTP-binding protein EngB [Cladobotryum mycophilum]|uniref:GTP-binding protein EngB n=1 Tax=Cladobotryum mycophilum TaxID=491253 RepID=A0ABR0SWP8_9HYPO
MKAFFKSVSSRLSKTPQGEIQILSDLHLEVGNQYSTYAFPVTAPLLLLAGDVGRLVDYDEYLAFLRRQVSRYENVFLVLGNHEFHGLSYEAGVGSAERMAEEPSVAGASYRDVQSKVSDFQRMGSWTAERHSRVHAQEVAWLRGQIAELAAQSNEHNFRRRVIIATHHAPCIRGTSSPEHVGSPLNCAFATELLDDGDDDDDDDGGNSWDDVGQTPQALRSPGLKPHKQILFISEAIRQGPDSALLTTTTHSLSEHHQFASAAQFFAHPSRFLYSAESLRHHPKNEHIPEVLILGASNVGKSSFLNALIGKPDAARVSAKPGKTTLMNAFAVGPPAKLARGLIPRGEKMPAHSLVVVDTPGYGFRSQASWGDAVLKYIGARKALRGAVLLIPSEKKISDQDRWLLRALAQANTRTMAVLTKADKSGGSWIETCSAMATNLRSELRSMERGVRNGWREGPGWNPTVFITSAGMDKVPKLGNGGGMGGVRAAILEMAGFNLQDKEVKKQDDTVAYTGAVVSFDDIKWKT